MKKIITFGLLFSFLAHAQTVPTITTTVKSTATLAAVCTIGTQNVNFGQISLPISAQSATSSMSVQCTKGSPYTIGLAYGGVYGQGSASGNYWTVSGSNNSYTLEYYSAKTGFVTGISGRTCAQIPEWDEAGLGSTNTIANTNWTCGQTGTFAVTTAYGYGKIVGMANGDSVAYSIQVPNNPSEVWNTGNYSYSSNGTGTTQSIPVVATLVPAQTTNKYPIPDSYLDTVVATITY